MITGIVIGSVLTIILGFIAYVVGGKILEALYDSMPPEDVAPYDQAEMIAHLQTRLADSNERERLLGEELKKYTEMAKGDCKACMVRRGIISSERELEIEVER